ncbi:MAG TPA: host-nuclease inhibitor Gam family protein [Caulobacteraceae bacterium]|nr:host-nuclease inhibitor Gam family protein [Caulobacteraceae bacterium]
MARSKAKAPAAPAAQSRAEAERLVARIGELQRELKRRDADLGDELAAVKERHQSAALPLQAELELAQSQVQGWCEANRSALTGDKTKTVQLATGKVFWRTRPPRVTVRGVEVIIETFKRYGLFQFIRTSEEIDKEAMLREPDVARRVAGVSIGSEGEDFIIEPFEAQLVEVAS